MRRLTAFVLCILTIAVVAGEAADPLPAPSTNAGRKGTYKVATSAEGINYYVCVPRDYTPEAPAGIHVFHHGMGAQAMARNFQLWAPFLDAGRCIGINLEYTDGNPHQDKAGKATAAREAVRQVMADYPVVVGRGAMTVFSAGGSPGGAWLASHGKAAKSFSPDWPFCHVNVFGAGLNCGEELTVLPCSWFRAMGEGEERMAPGLLRYLHGSTAANLVDPRHTACRDAVFLVTKGRGHTILPAEVALAADTFIRASTFLGPFLYRPVDVEAGIGKVIDAANAHRFAEAMKLHAEKRGTPQLKALIEAQMQRQLALLAEIAVTDPRLARYYADLSAAQFDGTPAARTLATTTATWDQDAAAWRKLNERWHAQFGKLFTGKGIALAPEAVPYLQEVAKRCGEKSTVGVMADKYLDFAPQEKRGKQEARR